MLHNLFMVHLMALSSVGGGELGNSLEFHFSQAGKFPRHYKMYENIVKFTTWIFLHVKRRRRRCELLLLPLEKFKAAVNC